MSSTDDGGRAAPDQVPGFDVVATVGALDPTVMLLREFLHRSGAIHAIAVIQLEDDVALVDVSRLSPVLVMIGERTVQLPHALELDAAVLMVPEVKQLPAFDVDPAAGEVRSPLGGLEHYAIAVRHLAQLLGADDVAHVMWETTTPEIPISITARASEDLLIVALGEEPLEMEPGWPVDSRPNVC